MSTPEAQDTAAYVSVAAGGQPITFERSEMFESGTLTKSIAAITSMIKAKLKDLNVPVRDEDIAQLASDAQQQARDNMAKEVQEA